ncbi:MAG: OsmC family protein [Flavobacteriales bacterium]
MAHHYALTTEWTGNTGTGTDGYRNYKREHIIRVPNKPDLSGSADPSFRGDPSRHNPEELLVAALSACHMLSYLHVCVKNRVVVTAYTDNATGTMETIGDGGRMTEVVLHPVVSVRDASMVEKAQSLHGEASKLCFIASSVNFPVRHDPTCRADQD